MAYRVEEIRSQMDELCQTELLGIVLHRNAEADVPNVTFHTPPGLTQQVATMFRLAGTRVEPHYHKPVLRQTRYTQEVLIVNRGEMRVRFYDSQGVEVAARILIDGEVVLLSGGGHSVEFLLDTDLIEIKQGPYSGAGDDKEYFQPKEPRS